MLMPATVHGDVGTNDLGRKIPYCTEESKLRQRRACWTLCQLNYIPTPLVLRQEKARRCPSELHSHPTRAPIGKAETLPQALGFQSLDPSLSQQAGRCLTAMEEDGVRRDLCNLNLFAKLTLVPRQVLFDES